MSRRRSQCGQATVELVALVPLLVAVGFAVLAVLSAGRASSAAESAAEAAAVAILRDGDGAAAARRSLEGRPRRDVNVSVNGGRVRVTVRPALPLLTGALTATAEADAGRVTPVVGPLDAVRGGDGAGSAPDADERPRRRNRADLEGSR